MDVRLGDELVKQSVALLVRNLALDRHQHILQVHDGVVELHGATRHVCLLPRRLDQLLLALNFGLADILSGLLHVLDDVRLRLLQLGQVVILLLSNSGLQPLQVIALWSQLEAIQVIGVAQLLEIGRLHPISLAKRALVLVSVQALLNLLV